ncbi:MAG: hypothetical protein AAF385_16060 [Pseudomonadota bacterium]
MSQLGVFDPLSVYLALTFQGTQRAMVGFSDGEYIGIEPSAPRSSVLVGVDGRFISSRSADTGVIIELALFARSTSNKRLYEIATTTNRFAVSLASFDSEEFGFSPSASITDWPRVGFGESAGARTWRIYASDWQRGGVEVVTG